MFKILGIGHPRTGTGYTSKLLTNFGLQVGHEILLRDGIVAWQYCLNHSKYVNKRLPWTSIKNPAQYEFENVIYNTRNPKTSILSIVWAERGSLNYRIDNFSKILEGKNPLEKAIISIIEFDKKIKVKYPNHFQYRIEDQSHNLYEYLNKKYVLNSNWNLPSNKTNSRKHPQDIDWNECDDKYKILINQYCIEYGYDPIYLNY